MPGLPQLQELVRAIGTAAGLVLGAAADYFLNKRREKKGRNDFIASNNKALDLTISQWKSKLHGNLGGAVTRWFEDARVGVIRLRQQTPQNPQHDPSRNTPML